MVYSKIIYWSLCQCCYFVSMGWLFYPTPVRKKISTVKGYCDSVPFEHDVSRNPSSHSWSQASVQLCLIWSCNFFSLFFFFFKHREMAQDTTVPKLNFKFWLDKAIEWGQANTLESQKDVCLHLPQLQEFLLQTYETLKQMVSDFKRKNDLFCRQPKKKICHVWTKKESKRLLFLAWGITGSEKQTGETVPGNISRNALTVPLTYWEGTFLFFTEL